MLSHRDPAGIDWAELGVGLVIESTGKFRARDDAALHLKGGARKVLISAPGKSADLTVVVGVNDADYDPQRHDVVSAASCTTNCVVPMVKVLHDSFGLVKGLMTTIHAYTGDQMLLDGPHKDLRRARSAAISIVPTSTGAARTTGVVIPELAGRLDGVAVRVPVEDGSLTDLTAVLSRDVTAADVNRAFEQAAAGDLSAVLEYSTDALVSRDIIGQPASCVFDSGLTQAAGSLVKVFGWYDNEWGYTCRLIDLAALIALRALARLRPQEKVMTRLPVTVGTDGSKLSLRAVDWAAREAAVRGLPLRIVSVPELPARKCAHHMPCAGQRERAGGGVSATPDG